MHEAVRDLFRGCGEKLDGPRVGKGGGPGGGVVPLLALRVEGVAAERLVQFGEELRRLPEAAPAVDLLAVPAEQQERRVGADAEGLGQVGALVAIGEDPDELLGERRDRGVGEGLALEDLAPVSGLEGEVEEDGTAVLPGRIETVGEADLLRGRGQREEQQGQGAFHT